jgi:hypothetical protein
MTVTTTNGIIKMPDAGDTVTMHVVKCEVIAGQYGEQVKFTDTRGDVLFITRASADRQLIRAGFVYEDQSSTPCAAYDDVDGTTLVFARDPNPKGKPYWSIRRIAGVEDAKDRPSLAARAKAEAERVRKAKGLPKDDGGSMGPYIPGLDGPPDVPPPTDADNPYAEAPSAPVEASEDAEAIPPREALVNAAYARAYAHAKAVQGEDSTAEAVQAGAATLLIGYRV